MEDKKNWSRYLLLSISFYMTFFLEIFVILFIEGGLLHFDLSAYTAWNKIVHHCLTVVIWTIVILCLILGSKKKYSCFLKDAKPPIKPTDWVWIAVCLTGCKVMTFIDWHTLKVIGEWKIKFPIQFCAQYAYYFMEVLMVLLIIAYSQKAFEVKKQKNTAFSYGGVILAVTWGAMHFFSRGVGLEVWNGISCIIFSLLSGVIFVKTGKRAIVSYILIAIGFLL